MPIMRKPKTVIDAIAHIASLRYFRKRSVIAVERALRQWAMQSQGIIRG